MSKTFRSALATIALVGTVAFSLLGAVALGQSAGAEFSTEIPAEVTATTTAPAECEAIPFDVLTESADSVLDYTGGAWVTTDPGDPADSARTIGYSAEEDSNIYATAECAETAAAY